MNRILLFMILPLCLAGLFACRQDASEAGEAFFKFSRQRVFRDVSEEALRPLLEQKVNEKKGTYGELIADFYKSRGYEPLLSKKLLAGKGAETLMEYLDQAPAHGLDPSHFQAAGLRVLLDSLRDGEIESREQALDMMAELEYRTARSLAHYALALQYGLLDPAEIFERYYIETERPDSTALASLFLAPDLETYLDSIQPAGESYRAMQQALQEGTRGPDLSAEETRRILIVNLERLRWRNLPDSGKYVLVNIPDFSLAVIEEGKPGLEMKVCVGEGRNMDYADSLSEVDEPEMPDEPGRWETPLLGSMIERVQVNPTWNIPKSIASREIIKLAAADPYYLENSNIDVFRGGERIEDSREINWDEVSGKDMPYTFRQRPGEQNALGRIKFLFDNNSSVYLHDTPAKAAFDREMRAVSHGCVRVEKPLELARALFGEGKEFELIKIEMQDEPEQPRNIELPEQIPIYLNYQTCWLDEGKKLQFRPDVYGLDRVLFSHLMPASGQH